MTTQLTPHFTLEELGGVGPIPPAIRANLEQLAHFLEAVRAAVGVPLQVTSGYRAPAHNAEVGGVATSQHMDGTAADVLPRGLTHLEFYNRFTAAEREGRIPPYGQVIYYPFRLVGASSGHIHLSLATRGKTGERLVRLNEYEAANGGRKYTTLSDAVLVRFPGAAGQAIASAVRTVTEHKGAATLAVLLFLALAGALVLLSHGGLRG